MIKLSIVEQPPPSIVHETPCSPCQQCAQEASYDCEDPDHQVYLVCGEAADLKVGGGGGCLLVSLLDLSKDARMQVRLSRWEGAVYEGVWIKGRTHGLWQLRVGLPDLVPIFKLAVNH